MRKKTIPILIALTLFLTLTTAQQEINDWNDLDEVHDDLSGDYVLVNDLTKDTSGYDDLAGENANGGSGWEPIGDEGNEFVGSFDGNGYEIKDLQINRSDESNLGLFGVVGEYGTIENVHVTIDGIEGHSAVGGLIGKNNGDVIGSSSTVNTIIGEESTGGDEPHHIGGFIGSNTGKVVDSHSVIESNGEVIGTESPYSFGGFIGLNEGNVSKSYSRVDGEVRGEGPDVYSAGGFIGENTKDVSNSYAVLNGNISADGDNSFNIGGFIGVNDINSLEETEGNVSESYTVLNGNISADGDNAFNIGGFIGENGGDPFGDSESYASESYAIVNGYISAEGSGAFNIGGLIGGNDGSLSNVFYNGEDPEVPESNGGTSLSSNNMTGDIGDAAGFEDLITGAGFQKVIEAERVEESGVISHEDSYPVLDVLAVDEQLDAKGVSFELIEFTLLVDWSSYNPVEGGEVEGFNIYTGVDEPETGEAYDTVGSNEENIEITTDEWDVGEEICVEVRPYNEYGEAGGATGCVGIE